MDCQNFLENDTLIRISFRMAALFEHGNTFVKIKFAKLTNNLII